MWGVQVRSLMVSRESMRPSLAPFADRPKTNKEQQWLAASGKRVILHRAKRLESMDKVLTTVKRCGKANAVMLAEQTGLGETYARRLAVQFEKDGVFVSEKRRVGVYGYERWWSINEMPDMRVRQTQDNGYAGGSPTQGVPGVQDTVEHHRNNRAGHDSSAARC